MMEVDSELTLCKTIIKDGAGSRFVLNLGLSGPQVEGRNFLLSVKRAATQ